MRSELIAHVGAQVGLLLLAWLLPSFIAWNLDPSAWDAIDRAFVALMWLFSAGSAFAFIREMDRP